MKVALAVLLLCYCLDANLTRRHRHYKDGKTKTKVEPEESPTPRTNRPVGDTHKRKVTRSVDDQDQLDGDAGLHLENQNGFYSDGRLPNPKHAHFTTLIGNDSHEQSRKSNSSSGAEQRIEPSYRRSEAKGTGNITLNPLAMKPVQKPSKLLFKGSEPKTWSLIGNIRGKESSKEMRHPIKERVRDLIDKTHERSEAKLNDALNHRREPKNYNAFVRFRTTVGKVKKNCNLSYVSTLVNL